MAELPADPFVRGSAGEQMAETGRMLIEQLLNMTSGEAVANAVFSLEERDLLAVVVVLMAHVHPSIDFALEAQVIERQCSDTRIKPPAVGPQTAPEPASSDGWKPGANRTGGEPRG